MSETTPETTEVHFGDRPTQVISVPVASQMLIMLRERHPQIFVRLLPEALTGIAVEDKPATRKRNSNGHQS